MFYKSLRICAVIGEYEEALQVHVYLKLHGVNT